MEVIKESAMESIKALEDKRNHLKKENERERELFDRKSEFGFICSSCGMELTFPCVCFMCGHAIHNGCKGALEDKCPFCTKKESGEPVKTEQRKTLFDEAEAMIRTTVFY